MNASGRRPEPLPDRTGFYHDEYDGGYGHPRKIRKCFLDFLRGMIPHHEAAIKMSESYLNYQGKSDELKTIAQDIITAQKGMS